MQSRDRVQFTFSDNHQNQDANVDAAIKAFGMKRSDAVAAFVNQTRIECRPSQFARFLIYRSDAVSINRFRELDAELFIPKPTREKIDVSGNPS